MSSKLLSRLDDMLAHALEHWRTTALGLLLAASVGYRVWTNPDLLKNPNELIQMAGSLGLIASRDPVVNGKKEEGE